jgi:3-hydroxyisobutyrate dehydrogenase-like beta-hydroxyacid dehydrogenase
MAEDVIGFVGLGAMGRGIAARLLQTGRRVRVWNRSAGAMEPLLAEGAAGAGSPAETVDTSGVVITMVANDAALEAVTLGPDGILARLGPGGVHVAMSTVSPALAHRLAEQHAAKGAAYVAAPVFGRPPAAAAGQLLIAVAGPAAAKARVRPLLEALGRAVADFGEPAGGASVVKLAGNFMIGAAVETMGEAFALVEKHGVSPRAFHELLMEGPFAAPIFQTYGQAILDRSFAPAGFKLSLGAKDVGLALAAAADAQVAMPLAGLVRDRCLTALAKGRGDLDLAALGLLAAEDAGLRT